MADIHYFDRQHYGDKPSGPKTATDWLRGRPQDNGDRQYMHECHVARDTANAMAASARKAHREMNGRLPHYAQMSPTNRQGFSIANRPHLGYFCIGRLPAVVDGERVQLAVFGANFTAFEGPKIRDGKMFFAGIPKSADDDKQKQHPMFWGVAFGKDGKPRTDLGRDGIVFQHPKFEQTVATCARLSPRPTPKPKPARDFGFAPRPSMGMAFA